VLVSFCQIIRPGQRLLIMIRNKLRAFRGVVSPLPKPQVGGPPPVSCPRLLIQYSLSYTPYLEADSSTRNLKLGDAVLTGEPLNMGLFPTLNKCRPEALEHFKRQSVLGVESSTFIETNMNWKEKCRDFLLVSANAFYQYLESTLFESRPYHLCNSTYPYWAFMDFLS
jgi:hypothetical protein